MALEIQNICKKYDNHDALKNISFSLKKGDIVGFLGPNGAGKSTLLKILSKDIDSSGGTMAFDKDIRIGFLRQDIDFVHGRTILEEDQPQPITITVITQTIQVIKISIGMVLCLILQVLKK